MIKPVFTYNPAKLILSYMTLLIPINGYHFQIAFSHWEVLVDTRIMRAERDATTQLIILLQWA